MGAAEAGRGNRAAGRVRSRRRIGATADAVGDLDTVTVTNLDPNLDADAYAHIADLHLDFDAESDRGGQ